jgi:NADH-quinone oxidoreductase subunit C
MRKYVPKDSVQAKAYYTDRFHIVPSVPTQDVSTDEVFAKHLETLKAKVDVKSAYIQVGQMRVEVSHEDNFKAIEILKNECGYEMMSEMSAVDYLARDNSFEIFYQLLNLKERKRVRVVCSLENGLAIESIVPLYKAANFAEREVFDMFGIYVNNHPFLKRIIMPDDWEGHPLLKSYPLEGDEFAQWYEVDKIFGKEAREAIGPENRDPSRIDRYDTKRFSRVGREVPFGADISDGEPETPIEYSETFLVNYNKGTTQLENRK